MESLILNFFPIWTATKYGTGYLASTHMLCRIWDSTTNLNIVTYVLNYGLESLPLIVNAGNWVRPHNVKAFHKLNLLKEKHPLKLKNNFQRVGTLNILTNYPSTRPGETIMYTCSRFPCPTDSQALWCTCKLCNMPSLVQPQIQCIQSVIP